ncbi:MAG: multiprotein bridging factor aMBF1 [Thermoplasmatota archaeon]
MPECEKCGKVTRAINLVNIAGASMYVCPECARYGTPIREKPKTEAAPPQRQVQKRVGKRKDALDRSEMELSDEYPRLIQRGRERMKWSREDLGRKINEKVSVISNLEHGTMHPSDSLIKKLEKALDIKLMVPVEDVQLESTASSQGMTLADFIVRKNK